MIYFEINGQRSSRSSSEGNLNVEDDGFMSNYGLFVFYEFV